MKKIKILKPVTIAALAAENMPRHSFFDFAKYFCRHELVREIKIDWLMEYFNEYPGSETWFILHGFIEEVEEREKTGVGSLWRHRDKSIYRLNQIGIKTVALLNVMGDRMAYTGEPIEVKNVCDLVDEEWVKTTGNNYGYFTRLHGRLEFVPDKEE